jgi:hypothetical protein
MLPHRLLKWEGLSGPGSAFNGAANGHAAQALVYADIPEYKSGCPTRYCLAKARDKVSSLQHSDT